MKLNRKMTVIINSPVIASEQSDRSNLLVNSIEHEIAMSTLKKIFLIFPRNDDVNNTVDAVIV